MSGEHAHGDISNEIGALRTRVTALEGTVTDLAAALAAHGHDTPPPPPPPDPEPVASIQAAVDAAPSGGTVLIPAGTYRETVTIRKPLTLRAVGAVKIDGQNTRQYAVDVQAPDVTVEGFEAFAHRPPYQRGAFTSRMVQRTTFRGLYAHDNPGAGQGANLGNRATLGGGIALTGGSGHVIEDCRIEANETCGIHVNGYGDGTTAGMSNVTIRRTTVKGNNPGGYNLGWHSGGVKFTKVDGITIEDCTVSGNRGDGLWGDIDVKNAVIRRNRLDHNSYAGIHYEISDLATIEDNVCWEDGWERKDGWGWGASIQVVESRRISIARNLVAWSNRGISVIVPNTGRGGSYPVSKPGSYDGIAAAGNTIVSSTGYLLFWGDGVGKGLFAGAADSTARYWSSATVVGSNGAKCAPNLTVPQRDAILTAATVPLTR